MFAFEAAGTLSDSVFRAGTTRMQQTYVGQLQGWSRPLTGEGLSAAEPVPVRHGRISAVDIDQRLLGSTLTDELGHFTLVVHHPDGDEVQLIAHADVWSGRGWVRVGPGIDDSAAWSEEVYRGENAMAEMELELDAEAASHIAIAIASTAARGLSALDHRLQTRIIPQFIIDGVRTAALRAGPVLSRATDPSFSFRVEPRTQMNGTPR